MVPRDLQRQISVGRSTASSRTAAAPKMALRSGGQLRLCSTSPSPQSRHAATTTNGLVDPPNGESCPPKPHPPRPAVATRTDPRRSAGRPGEAGSSALALVRTIECVARAKQLASLSQRPSAVVDDEAESVGHEPARLNGQNNTRRHETSRIGTRALADVLVLGLAAIPSEGEF
jgi:hypothetical protein